MKIVDTKYKEIYLHIGMPKTGTTAIQKYCSQNYELLKQNGVLYPKTGLHHSAHFILSSYLGFRHQQDMPNSWGNDVLNIHENLLHEIKEFSGKVVISSENFVLNKPIDRVKEFFDGFDVKIVIYLRRHDDWWESAYAQAVKMKVNPPWGKGIKGFINFNLKRNKTYANYRFLVDSWAKHFGAENIIVRPFEKAQNAPNLIFDFFSSIGLEGFENCLPISNTKENASLSLKSIQLLDVFQRLKVNQNIRERLISYALSLPSETRKQRLLSPDERIELIESNLEDYKYIAIEYLGKRDGGLFTELYPSYDHLWEPIKPLTAVEIAEGVVAALNS